MMILGQEHEKSWIRNETSATGVLSLVPVLGAKTGKGGNKPLYKAFIKNVDRIHHQRI